MAAVTLPSVVIFPTPGQAFSNDLTGFGKGLATAIAADPRFAEFDNLVSDIVDLELRQHEALADYDDDTIASCTAESDKAGSEPWCELYGVLSKEMYEFAEANRGPAKLPLDAVLQMKIADYYFAIGDVGFLETNEICAVAARSALLLLGLTPQTGIDELRSGSPLHVAAVTADHPHMPTPHGVNAGNLIIRIREAGDAYRRADNRAASLEDDSPEWIDADAEAMRLSDQIDVLRDEIIAGVNRMAADRNDDDPYRMAPVHQFTVWIELIDAIYPYFFEDIGHSKILPVIQQMRTEVPGLSNDFIAQAIAWNVKNGGANV